MGQLEWHQMTMGRTFMTSRSVPPSFFFAKYIPIVQGLLDVLTCISEGMDASGKPLIYFSMLFMLFHAFLSKKSTLFEKY